MAEEKKEHEGAEAAEHGEHTGEKHEGGENPLHPILDEVLFGIDASGAIRTHPYDEHGHPKEGYEPRVFAHFMGAPQKVEFTKHMAGLGVVAVVFFALSMVVARRVLAGLHNNKAPKGGLANAIEAIFIFVRDEMVEPVGGHHLGHYTPLFITYFLFILIANLMGMIPEFGGVTGNASIALALGGSIYILIWFLGLKAQGLGYVTHLVPPGTPWWMWPLMFILELAGPLIKCFVLCVR